MNDARARLDSALSDRYRIERELGQGGMATVYLAHDLRHDRRVALKVLRPDLAAVIGAERFLQEIRTTANLQHPHILPLHDSGQVDGTVFYVMPFVEGESLRDRLLRDKQLPVDEALRVAREVADALGYAHEHGIIHRDIKPENILLQRGHALVADFGIALAASKTGGSRMTETGMSLGTPHYMSPEQAMGDRDLGPRSDVYALGCVCYEMLCGEPPFTGPTPQAIVARVMTEAPRSIVSQRNTVSPEVEEAVLVALAKLPADRFATAADFAEALAGGKVQRRTGARAASQPRPVAPVRIPALIAALVIATALAAWGWLGRTKSTPPLVTRVRITMGPGQELAATFFQHMAISDDGRRIVYVGRARDGPFQLWLRELDAVDARPVAGTIGGYAPTFSPDGQWVAFVVDGKLRKVPVAGGEVTALGDSMSSIAPGAAWLRDGTIVYGDQNFELRALRQDGSGLVVVPRMAGDTNGRLFPRSLPRPDAVLIIRCNDVCNQMVLGTVMLSTGEFRPIADQAAGGWYAPTGHIVAVKRTGAVVAIPFDLDKLETRGEPIPLFDGVSVALGIVPRMWLSPAGTLLYELSGLAFGPTSTLVRVTRDGVVTPVDPSWPAAELGIPALSPDGKQVAISMPSGGSSHIWIKQLDRGTLSRLTTEGALNFAPQWRPGGGELAYVASEGGWHVDIRRPDGTGAVMRVAVPEATVIGSPNWTPDGRSFLLRVTNAGHDIFRIIVGADSTSPLLASAQFDELNPAIAPNGEWFAYQSNESGRAEIYLRPFPDAARERIPVSRSGGLTPGWSRDGRELFFVHDDHLISVPVTWSSARPTLGEPRTLFPLNAFVMNGEQPGFVPEPGGKTFLTLKAAEAPSTQLVLVLNWLEELKARVKGAQ